MPNLSDYNPAVKYGANLDVNVDLADIRDANNNELLELDTVASAVNFVSIANGATGTTVVLSAAGDDTNVGLQLTSKGTATVLVGNERIGTEAAGVVTVNSQRGHITTSALTTAASFGSATFDFVNNKISDDRMIFLTIRNGTNTGGIPTLGTITTSATPGSCNIKIVNVGTASALNGTLELDFLVF